MIRSVLALINIEHLVNARPISANCMLAIGFPPHPSRYLAYRQETAETFARCTLWTLCYERGALLGTEEKVEPRRT